MKSIAEILGDLLIESRERLLWTKGESDRGSLEPQSTRQGKAAARDWRSGVQLRALRQLVSKP